MEATSTPPAAPAVAPQEGPSPAFRRYLRQRRRERVFVAIVQLVLLVLVIGTWQVGARASWWDPILTSTPSTVWTLFKEMAGNGELWQHVWATLWATIVSFGISMLLGIAVATVLWWSPFVERVIDPYLVVLNAMPKIALGPILLVWLGAGRSVYGMAIIISLIVTVIMVYTGFTEVDANKVKVVRTFGGNKLQVFRKVIFPGSTPTLLAAIKVNLGLTLVGVIVGEFLASKAGLGYLILYGSQIFRMSMVMMSIVLLAVLSAVLYGTVMAAERLLFRRQHHH